MNLAWGFLKMSLIEMSFPTRTPRWVALETIWKWDHGEEFRTASSVDERGRVGRNLDLEWCNFRPVEDSKILKRKASFFRF